MILLWDLMGFQGSNPAWPCANALSIVVSLQPLEAHAFHSVTLGIRFSALRGPEYLWVHTELWEQLPEHLDGGPPLPHLQPALPVVVQNKTTKINFKTRLTPRFIKSQVVGDQRKMGMSWGNKLRANFVFVMPASEARTSHMQGMCCLLSLLF